MKNLYVISDIHGDIEALERALVNAKLLVDKPGRGLVKKRDAFIVQIGDLANCAESSREGDIQCLAKVGSWIDRMLVGNHEAPYFDFQNRFSGFWAFPEIGELLHDLNEYKVLLPAYCHEGVLITHAGISSKLAFGTDAREAHDYLCYEWSEKNYGHPIFRNCGWARGGRADVGGSLWCDFDAEFYPTEFPQIVGHTGGVLRTKGNAICIDTQRVSGPTVMKVG